MNLRPTKQGASSLIREATVHMDFALTLRDFLENLFCITCDKYIQNRCSKKSDKIHWKTAMLGCIFNKVGGISINFPVNFEKSLRTSFFREHLSTTA